MKIRLWLVCICLLCLLLPLQAQDEIDLTETYATDVFSIQYPADWEINAEMANETSVLLTAPIAGRSSNNSDIIVNLQSMTVLVSVVPNEGDSPFSQVEAMAMNFVDEVPDTQQGLSLAMLVNDMPTAHSDASNILLSQRFIVMSVDKETQADVLMNGAGLSQFNEAMPIVLGMLNTLRLAGDDTPIEALDVEYILQETHTRAGEWEFDYPSGWIVEENDAFTLLAIPNVEPTFGLSIIPAPVGIAIDDWADEVRQNILNNVSEAETSITELTVEGFDVRLMQAVISEENFGLTQLIASPDDSEALFNLSIIGDVDVSLSLLDIASAVIQTLRIP